MVSIVTKTIHGKQYLYLVKSIRKGNTVIQKTLKYIGKKRPIPKEEIECINYSHNNKDWILNKYKDMLTGNSYYIGRGSKYGNPYRIGPDGDRNDVCRKFENYAREAFTDEEIRKDLRGKDLICFCKPKRCHGDYLLWRANKITSFPK